MKALIIFLFIALMWFIEHFSPGGVTLIEQAVVSLGLLIFISFLFGRYSDLAKLSRMTGYIIAGMLCGPYILNFVPHDVVLELRLIDDLALAMIAFTAGGEVRLDRIKKAARGIAWISCLQIVVPFIFISALAWFSLVIFKPADFITNETALAIAIFFGVIAAATSPATTIAVIVETKAKGRLTDTVLGVTVIKDVIVLLLFVLCMAVADSLLSGGQIKLDKLGSELFGMGASLLGGVVIAGLVALYLKFIRRELVLFVIGLSIFIVFFTQLLHLHFLLTCIMAGFIVENFTEWGEDFIRAIERGSMAVFIIFFALAGANIDLIALQQIWPVALAFVIARALFTHVGTFFGAKFAGESTLVSKWGWAGFIGQAGVSLGMASVVGRTFPEWGVDFRTLAIAAIAINQLTGPAMMKALLDHAGETAQKRLKKGIKL